MTLFSLFLTFLKIGAVSFGGGYAMIPLIREEVLAHGWLDDATFLDLVAVSESTPGPIAVNMATFVGATQAGLAGSALATLGVVLPSFIIILLVAVILRRFLDTPAVRAALAGMRPVIAGLITATGATMLLSGVFGWSHVTDPITPDPKAALIFLTVAALASFWKKRTKKRISPILLILLSAGMGMLFFGLVP